MLQAIIFPNKDSKSPVSFLFKYCNRIWLYIIRLTNRHNIIDQHDDAFFSPFLFVLICHAANAAFGCLLTADAGIGNVSAYRAFSKQQIDYALDSTGRSFVVGFGLNPPQQCHHRAAYYMFFVYLSMET